MEMIKTNWKGIMLCLVIGVPAWLLGRMFPLIGAPVFSIIVGASTALLIGNKEPFNSGVAFTSKKILQYAIILLGFGLDLSVLVSTGLESLPIIVTTISIALLTAFLLHKFMHMSSNISILIGVGSSICGGSAIVAASSVIDSNDEEIAQAISVIFFFNVIAALTFPTIGGFLGMSNHGFGIFAGTAINDTSSVTAAAAAWDALYEADTLTAAAVVKLTRTLAIIPITLVLALYCSKKDQREGSNKVRLSKIFPSFIVYFVAASIVTTICVTMGIPYGVFMPLKSLSKFFIVMAMAAIGFNTNLPKLVRTGGKPLFMGLCCWLGITFSSLLMQQRMDLW